MPTNPNHPNDTHDADTHDADTPDRSARTERVRPKPTPTGRPSGGTSTGAQIAIAVALVAVGAIGALVIEHAGTTGGIPVAAFATPAPATPTPSAVEPSLSAAPGESASASESASESASPSPTPASAVLEAALPHYVKNTTLSVQSIVGLSQLGHGPSVRSMGAALASYGTKPDTLEVAEAYDPAGSLNLTVLGFRQPGLDVAKMRTVVLDGWLAANVPGVKTSSVTLSGVPATEIDYGAGGKTEWLLVKGDSVFDIAADNRADAEAAVAAFGNTAPATSPGSPSPSAP